MLGNFIISIKRNQIVCVAEYVVRLKKKKKQTHIWKITLFTSVRSFASIPFTFLVLSLQYLYFIIFWWFIILCHFFIKQDKTSAQFDVLIVILLHIIKTLNISQIIECGHVRTFEANIALGLVLDHLLAQDQRRTPCIRNNNVVILTKKYFLFCFVLQIYPKSLLLSPPRLTESNLLSREDILTAEMVF